MKAAIKKPQVKVVQTTMSAPPKGKKLTAPHLGKRQSSRSSLTDVDVRRIRLLAETGITQTKLGEIFGVSGQAVNFIVNRKTWQHVK